MSDKPATSRPVELAAITGAHGVAGEVRLKLFGESADTLSQHKQFNEGALTLKKIRSDNKGGAIACFAEVSSRGEAEKLRGTVLHIAREELPSLVEGEFYHADLVGLNVVTDLGEPVGVVLAIQNFGATDIVEILREPAPEKGQKTFMVPMIDTAVLRWDAETLVISADFVDD